MKTILTLSILLVSSIAFAAPDREGFDKMVQPMLADLCADCHGGSNPKGDVSLDNIAVNLAGGGDLEKWTKVLDQLTLGEMPPAEETQPTETERAHVIAWIRAEMIKAGVTPEDKLARPGFGNYVPHDKLFGDGEVSPSFSAPRVWRIRPAVYNERMVSIAKNGKYVKPFSLSSSGHGFKDYDNQYKLAGADLNQLLTNAKNAAEQLTEVREDKGELKKGNSTPNEFFALVHPEDAPASDDQIKAAIGWLFPRVMLRDATPDEETRLLDFAKMSIESDGKILGVRNLIAAILLNPESLYRSHRGGESEPDEHGRIRLSNREIAYALAYSLTDARPDQQLLKADLSTDAAIRAQIERILADEKIAKPRILGFFREYFDYGGAVDVFKDEALFRSHSPETLVADTDRLILYFYERDRDVLRELLTTNLSFVQYGEGKDGPVRTGASGHGAHLHYNLPPDWKWIPDQPIELPGNQRAGILTQPAWLVAKSGNFDNDAILRGHWVRTRLLGGTIPDLPITVDAQLPEDETKTLRERMEVTREDYCWKCHSRMNPLGEAFEMFDHFGRWRTRELGKPVVTTGAIDKQEVSDAIEMIHQLAGSEHVRQVFVRHAFRYFMGRNETLDDAASLRRADAAYVKSGGSMKQLIASLLTSDSFLFVKP